MKPKCDIRRDGIYARIPGFEQDGIAAIPDSDPAAEAFANVFHLAHLEHPYAFGRGYKSYNREIMEDLVYNPGTVKLGYVHHGCLVGGLVMSIDEKVQEAYFVYLFRLDRVQKLGIGKRLMQAGTEIALTSDVDRMVLSVTSVNKRAKDLYECLGFRASSAHSSPHGFKLITMTLTGEDNIRQAQQKLLDQS